MREGAWSPWILRRLRPRELRLHLAGSSTRKERAGEEFMVRSAVSGAALALVVAGCGGLAKFDPDQTPINPTAVLEMHAASQGTRDFPAFESVTLTSSRANMQRTESSVKGAGTFTRLAGAGDSETRIDRLDRKLAWPLDGKYNQHAEGPLKCSASPIPNKPRS